MMEYENIVVAQGRRFFWPGATHEDVEQEARLALCRAKATSPGLAKTVIRRHLIEQVRRETRRRPQLVELHDQAVDHDARMDARETLREVLGTPLSALERKALGRALRGESCHKGALDNALQRARRKIRA